MDISYLINVVPGYHIIETPMMHDIETQVIRRSWRERLFSWPWRPWQAEKAVMVYVPKEEVLIDHQNQLLIMHPVVATKLRKQLMETTK